MSATNEGNISIMPPMTPFQPKRVRPKRKKRETSTEYSNMQWRHQYKPQRLEDLNGPDHLVASQLPQGFPPELAFRALGAYSLIRTLSLELRLSPFTPNVFLRALNLPYPSRLLGQVHVALLRVLLHALQMGYSYKTRGGCSGVTKRRKVDGRRWPLRAGDNLTYLDPYTWPVFFDDYVHLTADVLFHRIYNSESFVDSRNISMQHTGTAVDSDSDDDDVKSKSVVPIRKPAPSFLHRGRRPRQRPRTQPKKPVANDSGSEASIHSDESDSDDEDFAAPRIRQKGPTGRRRGRPRGSRKQPVTTPEPAEISRRPQSTQKKVDSLKESKPNLSAVKPKLSASSHQSVPAKRTLEGVNDNTSQASTKKAKTDHDKPLEKQEVPVSTMTATAAAPANGAADQRPVIPPVNPAVSVIPFVSVAGVRAVGGALDSQQRSVMPSVQSLPMVNGNLNTQGMAGLLMSYPMMSNVPRPGINTFPRPGIPSQPNPYSIWTQSHQPKPAQLKAPPVPKIKVQKAAERGGYGVPNDVADRIEQFIRKGREGPRSNLDEGTKPTEGIASGPPDNPRPNSQTNASSTIEENSVETGAQAVLSSPVSPTQTVSSSQHDVTMERDGQAERVGAHPRVQPSMGTTSTASPSGGSSETIPENTSSGQATNFQDEWPQFKPVNMMRGGIPYHRLPVEKKLDALEFLIDELLTVEYIAAEITRRQLTNECFSNKFAPLPTEEELENLENADECAVCALEGDLLCCDRCPRSFHRRCLGMNEHVDLGDGLWLCPECKIIDPAKFGSLRGGSKAGIDWFGLDDVLVANRMATGSGRSSFSADDQSETTGKQSGEVRSNDSVEPAAENSLLLDPTLSLSSSSGIVMPNTNGSELTFGRSGSDTRQFLVVHGFVFARDGRTEEANMCNTFDKMKALEASSKAYFLSTSEDVFITWARTGHEICSKWPMVQVPLVSSKVWGGLTNPQTEIQSLQSYYSSNGTFDPSSYSSAYNKAPLPKVLSVSAARQLQLHQSDFETVNGTMDTRFLSSQLNPDMSCDSILTGALHHDKYLFNPYKMVSNYLEGLEASFRRARLLHETWGMRNRDFREDIWSRNVRASESIRRLSQLLVDLVDSTHPIAFAEEWYLPSGGRKSVGSDNVTADTKLLHTVPNGWTQGLEKKKRSWDECSATNFRLLLTKEGCTLDSVLEGAPIRLPSSDKRKKRKASNKQSEQVKACKDLSKMTQELSSKAPEKSDSVPKDRPEAIVKDCSPSVDTPNSSQGVKDSSALEQSCDDKTETDAKGGASKATRVVVGSQRRGGKSGGPRRSRRNPRGDGGDGSSVNPYRSIDNFSELVEDLRKQQIRDVTTQLLSIPVFIKEVHWPRAGRKLFDPSGYLPPAEMRRLARNAGSLCAPYLTYSNTFEVGQPSVYHAWRKMVLCCPSFEQLLFQIRVLDSYLDKEIIPSCESAGRRYNSSRVSLAKVVSCSLRDVSTGQLQYFVLNQNKGRGAWFPCGQVEAGTYIVERNRRAAKLREHWDVRHTVYVQKRLEMQEKKAAALAEEEAKRRRMEAAKAAALEKERELQREQRKETVAKMKGAFRMALIEYESEVETLCWNCIELNMNGVPQPKMNALRVAALKRLKVLNNEILKFGGTQFDMSELTRLLTEAESRTKMKIKARLPSVRSNHSNSVQSSVSFQSDRFSGHEAVSAAQGGAPPQHLNSKSQYAPSQKMYGANVAQHLAPSSAVPTRRSPSSESAVYRTSRTILPQTPGLDSGPSNQTYGGAHQMKPTQQSVNYSRVSSQISSLRSRLLSAGSNHVATTLGSQNLTAYGSGASSSNDMARLLRKMGASSHFDQQPNGQLQRNHPLQPPVGNSNNMMPQLAGLRQGNYQGQSHNSFSSQYDHHNQSLHFRQPPQASYLSSMEQQHMQGVSNERSTHSSKLQTMYGQHHQNFAQVNALQGQYPRQQLNHGMQSLNNAQQSLLNHPSHQYGIQQQQQSQGQQGLYEMDFEPRPLDEMNLSDTNRYRQNLNFQGRGHNQWM